MAKTLEELEQLRNHMLINPTTSGDAQHVEEFMVASGWPGEIFIKLDTTDHDATIFTLGDDAETLSEFLNKEKILELIGDADLEISAITPSATNVREEYALVDKSGSTHGVSIKIYKDSSLYSAYLGHVDDALADASGTTVIPGTGDTALCFIYLKTDGTYELVAVNVQSFLEESEFGNGLQVVDHVVSVKVDSDSSDYLGVSSSGVSANVQEIASATSADTGLADSYEVREFAIADVSTATTKSCRVAVIAEDGDRKLDFSKISINCGTF